MEGGILYWPLKFMLKEALTTVVCLHRDAVEGPGGAPLPATLKAKQKGFGNGVSLSMGLGERAPLIRTLTDT